MKITVAAKELVRALKASHTEPKTTIPILCFVRIVADAHLGTIALYATDLDLYTVIDVAGQVIEGGEGLIPYRQTLAALQGETGEVELALIPGVEGREPSYYTVHGPDDEELSRHNLANDADLARIALIEADGHRVHYKVRPADDGIAAKAPWVSLRISGCDFKLYGAALANFPSFDHLGADKAKTVVTVPVAAFRRALDRVAVAISHEASRYTLNGLLIVVEREAVLFVATDGHRLSKYGLLGDFAGQGRKKAKGTPAIQGKYLVPDAGIHWLQTNLSEKAEGNVTFSVAAADEKDAVRAFHFSVDGKRIAVRPLTGQFPNYEAVVPQEDSARFRAVILDSAALVKTLGRLAKVADERSGAIKVRVNGALTLTASSTDAGEALATVPALIHKFDGKGARVYEETTDEVAVGFNSFYLSEFLRLAGKTEATLAIRDAQSAAWFTAPVADGESWQYVLMPMRI